MMPYYPFENVPGSEELHSYCTAQIESIIGFKIGSMKISCAWIGVGPAYRIDLEIEGAHYAAIADTEELKMSKAWDDAIDHITTKILDSIEGAE